MAKENKYSKRVKITMKDILPAGFKPMDMSKYYEDRKKRIEEDEERYKREIKAEELRRVKLKCPCCKSAKKEPVSITHRDGPLVCGGRNHVQTLAQYNICQDCGVMYVDLDRKEIALPLDRNSYLF
jgi:hypothetical protein